MARSKRAHWGSRIGFVLAAAGSAVGLGNLWKFPYITWKNHGGTFVIVYLVAIALLGLPLMMSELLVGRRAQLSPVSAFERLGGKNWSFIGWLSILSAGVILSYYTVIAGWSLHSFYQCMGWSISGYQQPPKEAFGQFIANVPLQLALTAAFSLITATVVYRGVGKGIEKTSEILMPVLLLILLYLGGTAMTMSGSGKAAAMMFVPHMSNFRPASVLEAVGHSFFTLSLGLGAMITYGSYMKKESSIFRSALSVVIFDTVVALIACFAMFSIIFSVPGLQDHVKGSTVGMLFVTLPRIFYNNMPGGVVLAPLFYVLVAFAAVTSTISLSEVLVSQLMDRRGWSRPRATVIATMGVFVGSIFSAVSLGGVKVLSSFEIFHGKPGVLSTLDHLASNWMLPLGGLLTTLFVGWKIDHDALLEELGLERSTPAFLAWRFIVRFVAPIAILAILIAVATGKDFS